jgi:hypothetical protein
MESIKQEQTLLESIQEVRYLISKESIKKSGFNDHLKFSYVELADFEPLSVELFWERRVTPIFKIYINPSDGVEYASLTVYKGAESMEIALFPTAEAMMSNPIQSLGSKITYCRRYAYMIGLCLSVRDSVDSMAEPPKANLVTNEQWAMINKLYTKDEVKAMYKDLGITNGKQIPRDVAQKMIDDKSISDKEATTEKAFF